MLLTQQNIKQDNDLCYQTIIFLFIFSTVTM